MKIVTAFDSFKCCISAAEACKAASEGLLMRFPDADIAEIPLSDGGEGLVACICGMLDVDMVTISAHGPLMEEVMASYAITPDRQTAYMEMASTSGLPLVPMDKRNPLLTTTYGVGDIITDALSRGCTYIIIGIGGSATNDGGKGMILSLKDKELLDTKGNIIDDRLKSCKIRVACDVSNPLCGVNGASYVFGPQKGATPEQVKELDSMLHAFADESVANGIASTDLENYPGTGAAGGLGYGLMAYLKAELLSGIDIILDIVDFDNRIKGADLIITGEGKSDEQTLMGKVPHGVLKRAARQNIPVVLLSGAIDDPHGSLSSHFSLVSSINEGDRRDLSVLLQPKVALENLRKSIGRLPLTF